jgi:ketosteroid isomerase-like protein
VGAAAVFGKEAIRALYESVFKDYVIRSESRVMEVEASGDFGYFWVTYHLTAVPKVRGTTLEEDGKAVFIVKRSGGTWKIARLIDNSDLPPTGG